MRGRAYYFIRRYKIARTRILLARTRLFLGNGILPTAGGSKFY